MTKQPAELFRRHKLNPILTAEDWPYPVNSVFNPGAAVLHDGTTPLRNVGLPVQLTQAIEQKQKADQKSQRMEFILTKEKQEADRKRIETKGIADFQFIGAAGIIHKCVAGKAGTKGGIAASSSAGFLARHLFLTEKTNETTTC